MDKKPVSEKKNLFGKTVRKTFSKTTNRDYEGMPYGRETVKKMKVVKDKEGNFVRGKKVTFQEKSTGSRVLGSRKVERFSAKKGNAMPEFSNANLINAATQAILSKKIAKSIAKSATPRKK